MTQPCEAWSGELSHPSPSFLEEADLPGVSHIPQASTAMTKLWKDKKYVIATCANATSVSALAIMHSFI